MKKYSTDRIRNIALISHGGAGKTSLTEAMLYDSKAINRLGRVDNGNTVTDFDPEEIKRSISISTGIAPVEWRDCKINVLDTPGYFDFVGEVKAALHVADAAVVVVCAVSGIEVGTELVWNYADEHELPRLVVINKMNRENANYYKVVEDLRETYGTHVVPLYVPVGKEDQFSGVVDILRNKAYTFKDGGRTVEETDVPADVAEQMEEYRIQLIEAIVEQDDELMMLYLEGEEVPDAELEAGLRKAVMGGSVVPILCASATENIGIQPIMDTIVELLPSPADVPAVKALKPGTDEEVELKADAKGIPAAMVFKTMADPYVGKISIFRVYSGAIKSDTQYYNTNRETDERLGGLFVIRGKEQESVNELVAGDIGGVAKLSVTGTGDTLCDKNNPVQFKPIEFPEPVISMAVVPVSQGDEEKIGSGLARLQEEDATFIAQRNIETGENIISGMGDMHLEIIKSRLSEKFGVQVELSIPKIPYRETIRKKVKSEYKHKKQTGGKGQYGHVIIEIEPLHDEEKTYEFEDKIFGGAVPRQYIPAVDKGIQETLNEGALAGYPVVNVKVTLLDGSYHSVDSSEMAFKIAASQAFKKGFLDANPILLEPILNVEVIVPEEYMGDIMGDLNKKRGRILGMEPRGRSQVVKAQVPQAEMAKYATELRSMTQGRGLFKATFSHYEEVPAHLAEKIIAEAKKED